MVVGFFHDAVSFCLLRPRQPGPFGASRQTRDGLLPTGGIVPPGARRNRRNRSFTLWKIIVCESRFVRLRRAAPAVASPERPGGGGREGKG